MNLKKASRIIFALAIMLWAAIYVLSAIGHAQQLLFPPEFTENMAFGPHLMPWSEVMATLSRGIFGIILSVLIFIPRLHSLRWKIVLTLTLLAINLYNLHSITMWAPEAEFLNISVFAFFPAPLIALYALELISLIVGAYFLAAHARHRRLKKFDA